MEYDQDEPAVKKQDNSTTPIGDQKREEPTYRAFESCSYGGGFNPACPRGGCD